MTRRSKAYTVLTRAAVFAILAVSTDSAHAGVVIGDFLALGDQLLVTDTTANLEWLKPSYTTFQTYDNAFIQQIRNDHGFRYATETEVMDMLNANFDNPPVGVGTAAGYLSAQAFFAVFGVNQSMTCGFPATPCPRTQGLTSSLSVIAGRHDAVGMIILDSDGWMIQDNAWPDGLADQQMGSWLVRELSSPVPEPAAWGLMLTAVVGEAIARRVWTLRRRSVR